MPPKNVEHVPNQAAGQGRRPVSGRIVPAIPLALSKPKFSQLQRRVGSHVERISTKIPNNRPGQASQTNVETADLTENAIELQHDAGHVSKQEQEQEQEQTEAENAVTSENSPVPTLNGSTTSARTGEDSAKLGARALLETRPPTPPTDEEIAPSPTVTVSPDTVRRPPTDRFDIRKIRTDFPPAFVPAAEQQTPRSAASSQSRPQLPAHYLSHASHPSASSIVFGSRESSSASPASGQQATSTSMQLPHAVFTVPGHTHAQEPYVQRPHQMGFQAPMPWPIRPGQGSPAAQPNFHPPSHLPFRYPPRESFTSILNPQPNGHSLRSREGSQSSSIAALEAQPPIPNLQSPIGLDPSIDEAKPLFTEQENAVRVQAPHRFTQFFPPPPQMAPSFQKAEMAANYENVEALRMHLLNQLGTADFSDCHLQILDDQTGTQQSFCGHRVILARSSRLLQIMREQGNLQQSTASVSFSIRLSSQYLRIPPLLDGIRCLYGGPLPPPNLYRSSPGVGDASVLNEERMMLALQHVAMGIWLQIPAIAHKATEIAANLLHWDTLVAVLTFALDGGLSQAWSVDDGSVERISTCSSDDSLGKSELTGFPSYDPHATYLLHRIINFMVHSLPPSFYLDTSALQLIACPRLPAAVPTHRSRPSLTDPRLSKIRFGEVPTEEHTRPPYATAIISSVLLSLPFPVLKAFLEHFDLSHRLGPETVSSIMRSVIHEREIRRQKALKEYQSASRETGLEASQVQNLFWEESVSSSSQHRAGYRLTRKRRGIDTPSSSGAESERPQ